MKRISSVIAAFICLVAVSAQETSDNLYWGVRAGVDITLPGNWHYGTDDDAKMYSAKAGGSIGAFLNVPLPAGMFVEPGAGLYYDTYRYDNMHITDETGIPVESNPTIRKIGLRVPVVFGYRLGLSERCAVSVFSGPELNYSFGGKVSFNHDYEYESSVTELFGKDGQRRCNVAWTAGASFEWDYNWVLSLVTSFGMNNLLHHDASYKENRVSLSLGYCF